MDLTISQLIKIILGVLVVVVVVSGMYFFGSYVSDFFKNLPGGEDEEKRESIKVVDSGEENLEGSAESSTSIGDSFNELSTPEKVGGAVGVVGGAVAGCYVGGKIGALAVFIPGPGWVAPIAGCVVGGVAGGVTAALAGVKIGSLLKELFIN